MLGAMGLLGWWQRARATQILVVTAAVFLTFAAVLLVVVRRDGARTVETEMQQRVATAAQVMRGFTSANGEPRITPTGALVFGTTVENADTALVDRVKEVTGAEAMVFQVVKGKPIVIASTMTNDDRRMLGAPLTGPARAAFDNGQEFSGISPVRGRPYLNHYAIVHNDLGEPIALLYDGVPLDAVDEAVARRSFRS